MLLLARQLTNLAISKRAYLPISVTYASTALGVSNRSGQVRLFFKIGTLTRFHVPARACIPMPVSAPLKIAGIYASVAHAVGQPFTDGRGAGASPAAGFDTAA